jgi:hypothetical protein
MRTPTPPARCGRGIDVYKLPRPLACEVQNLAATMRYDPRWYEAFRVEQGVALLRRLAAAPGTEGTPAASALGILADAGRWPVACGVYNPQARWYPDAGGNRQWFASDLAKGTSDDTRCLLPVPVYEALAFPRPERWPSGQRYPWFWPFETAIEAAVDALVAMLTDPVKVVSLFSGG